MLSAKYKHKDTSKKQDFQIKILYLQIHLYFAMKERNGILRFLFFTATRTFGTIVDVGVVWLLTDFVFEDYFWVNVVSPTISFEMAVVVNFITSSYLVFRNRIDNSGKRSVLKRFLKFNLSAVMGYCIKLMALNLLKLSLGWHTALCNFIALAVAGIFNFLIADKWVFKKITHYEEDDDDEGESDKEICK